MHDVPSEYICIGFRGIGGIVPPRGMATMVVHTVQWPRSEACPRSDENDRTKWVGFTTRSTFVSSASFNLGVVIDVLLYMSICQAAKHQGCDELPGHTGPGAYIHTHARN